MKSNAIPKLSPNIIDIMPIIGVNRVIIKTANPAF